MDEKTHWKLLVNPDYIGAYWLPPGEDVTVTIDYVVREVITGTNGKKEECSVAHLKGGVKPFILNMTNSKSIAKLYGPYIEDWAGKKITLFASTAKLAGEVVECLRIRPQVAAKVAKPIADERFNRALTAIKDGTYTAIQLRTSAALTEAQEKTLEEALTAMAAADVPEATHA
jgi:transcriptional regulator of met regulon